MKRTATARNHWTAARSTGPSLALVGVVAFLALLWFQDSARDSWESGALSWSMVSAPRIRAPFRRSFDGSPSSIESSKRFAVVIDNMRDGRPPAGVNAAGLVIEAPVEAGITRWLAFYEFNCQLSIVNCQLSKIGPVRSLRPYFLELAEGYRTPIAYVGGSPEALKRAKKSELFTANEFAFGRYFFRDPKRRDPHRIFTSTALFSRALEEIGVAFEELQMPWKWKQRIQNEEFRMKNSGIGGTNSAFNTQYSTFRFVRYPPPPETELSWTYNSETALFFRKHGGELQHDEAGNVITAKNLFVVETSILITDAIGRRRITTTGTGTAWRLTPKGKERLIWKRADREPFTFLSTRGQPLELEPGAVWIMIVPAGQGIVETTIDH